MSLQLRSARVAIQTALESISSLPGIAVYLERAGVDIEQVVEESIAAKGLAIVILSPAGAVTESTKAGRVLAHCIIPVCLLENPTVNNGPGGFGVSSEDAVELILTKLIGGEFSTAGYADVTPEIFRRAPEEFGLVTHYINLEVPIMFNRSSS